MRKVITLFVAGICASTWAWAVPSSATSDSKSSAVETDWPGIKFEVASVKRLDSAHIVIALHVVADASVKQATLIGVPDPSPPTAVGTHGATIKKPPTPFYLTTSSVRDQTTQAEVKADPTVPDNPFLGPNSITTALIAKQWVQLSVKFSLPAPAPASDGSVPVQKIDVVFPKAKGPIKDVIVPAIKR